MYLKRLKLAGVLGFPNTSVAQLTARVSLMSHVSFRLHCQHFYVKYSKNAGIGDAPRCSLLDTHGIMEGPFRYNMLSAPSCLVRGSACDHYNIKKVGPLYLAFHCKPR